jgi:hypothetical protein
LKLEHVERVLKAYGDEFENTLIRRRFVIDGSRISVDEMFDQWKTKMTQSYLTEIDMLRMLTRK